MKTNVMVGEVYTEEASRENIYQNLSNYYYSKLAILLCNTKENYQNFINEFYNIDDVAGSLRKYRRFMLDYRSEECKQEFFKLMQKQIHNKDWDNLYITLRQLFLEPFDKWIVNKIVEKIEKGLTAEVIYDWYLRGKNIKSIITFNIEYIKN